MINYVIKAGGSGNILETDYKHQIDWLEYRKFQINQKFFQDLTESLITASTIDKVIYINGGVAAYLFINLAKSLSLDSKVLDTIGCNIINITSGIILEKLKKESANVYPELISPLDINNGLVDEYNIIVVKAIPKFKSTDALATFVASQLINSKLLFFKKGVPIYHVGFPKPTEVKEFVIDDLLLSASQFNEVPGENYILDMQSLGLIKRHNIKTTIYNSDNISNLPEILNNYTNEFPKTNILIREE